VCGSGPPAKSETAFLGGRDLLIRSKFAAFLASAARLFALPGREGDRERVGEGDRDREGEDDRDLPLIYP